MRWQGVPDHLDAGNLFLGCVFGEVLAVSSKDIFLDHANGIEAFPFDIAGYGLGHATNVVVLAQEVNILLAKGVYGGPVTAEEELREFLISGGVQELVQGHREHSDQFHHADRERLVFVDGDTQQRTGDGDVVLREVFLEVFETAEGGGAFLNFINDDEGVLRHNVYAGMGG